MALVTLRGQIPVYVQVDTDAAEVKYVCASDEEFCYLDADHLPIDDLEETVPEAFTESGEPLGNELLAAEAASIAETTGTPWPAWSWGW